MKRPLIFLAALSLASMPFAQSSKVMRDFNKGVAQNNSAPLDVKVSPLGGSSVTNTNVGSQVRTASPKDVGANNDSAPPVPEPATMIALGVGITGVIARRRRQAK